MRYPVKPIVPKINWFHPLTKRLILDVPLFERSGTTVRNLGTAGRVGTFTDAPVWKREWWPGVSFDGTNDAIQSSVSSFMNQNDNFTMECWFKLDSLPGAEAIPFQISNTGDNAGISFSLETGQFKILTNGIDRTSTGVNYAINTIYHGIIRRLNGNTTFFLNGKDIGPNISNAPNSNTTTWTIGAGIASGGAPFRFFPGTVYLARMWSMPLSVRAIQTLYRNPWIIYQPVRPALGYTPVVTRRIAAGADDASRGATQFFPTVGDLDVGKPFGSADGYRSSFLRFTSINIPKNAIITSAKLTFTARDTLSGTAVNSTVKGEAADNPSAITSNANWDARTKTFASVAWNNIPAWTSGSQYDSPDISSIIQEIVNRSGWASGNALLLFWEDNGSTGGAGRTTQSYEANPAQAALLTITYLPPSSGGMPIFSDVGLVS